jgi:hypothetical protein
MTYLLFAVALGLSAVAAYYAVVGLIAIFAAAVIPIAIMGSLLEASKLVVASWLYRELERNTNTLKVIFYRSPSCVDVINFNGHFRILIKSTFRPSNSYRRCSI